MVSNNAQSQSVAGVPGEKDLGSQSKTVSATQQSPNTNTGPQATLSEPGPGGPQGQGQQKSQQSRKTQNQSMGNNNMSGPGQGNNNNNLNGNSLNQSASGAGGGGGPGGGNSLQGHGPLPGGSLITGYNNSQQQTDGLNGNQNNLQRNPDGSYPLIDNVNDLSNNPKNRPMLLPDGPYKQSGIDPYGIETQLPQEMQTIVPPMPKLDKFPNRNEILTRIQKELRTDESLLQLRQQQKKKLEQVLQQVSENCVDSIKSSLQNIQEMVSQNEREEQMIRQQQQSRGQYGRDRSQRRTDTQNNTHKSQLGSNDREDSSDYMSPKRSSQNQNLSDTIVINSGGTDLGGITQTNTHTMNQGSKGNSPSSRSPTGANNRPTYTGMSGGPLSGVGQGQGLIPGTTTSTLNHLANQMSPTMMLNLTSHSSVHKQILGQTKQQLQQRNLMTGMSANGPGGPLPPQPGDSSPGIKVNVKFPTIGNRDHYDTELERLAKRDFTVNLRQDQADCILEEFETGLLKRIFEKIQPQNDEALAALRNHNEALCSRMLSIEHHLLERSRNLSQCRYSYFLEIQHLRNQVYLQGIDAQDFNPTECYFFDPTSFLEEELRQQLNGKIKDSVRVYFGKWKKEQTKTQRLENEIEDLKRQIKLKDELLQSGSSGSLRDRLKGMVDDYGIVDVINQIALDYESALKEWAKENLSSQEGSGGTDNSAHADELARKQAEIDALEERIAELENDVSDITGDRDRLQGLYDNSEFQVQELTKKVSDLEIELQGALAKLKQLENTNLSSGPDEIRKSTKLGKDPDELRDELERELRAAIEAEYRSRIEALEQEIESLKQEIQSLNDKISQLEQENQAMKDENEKLKQDLQNGSGGEILTDEIKERLKLLEELEEQLYGLKKRVDDDAKRRAEEARKAAEEEKILRKSLVRGKFKGLAKLAGVNVGGSKMLKKQTVTASDISGVWSDKTAGQEIVITRGLVLYRPPEKKPKRDVRMSTGPVPEIEEAIDGKINITAPDGNTQAVQSVSESDGPATKLGRLVVLKEESIEKDSKGLGNIAALAATKKANASTIKTITMKVEFEPGFDQSCLHGMPEILQPNEDGSAGYLECKLTAENVITFKVGPIWSRLTTIVPAWTGIEKPDIPEPNLDKTPEPTPRQQEVSPPESAIDTASANPPVEPTPRKSTGGGNIKMIKASLGMMMDAERARFQKLQAEHLKNIQIIADMTKEMEVLKEEMVKLNEELTEALAIKARKGTGEGVEISTQTPLSGTATGDEKFGYLEMKEFPLLVTEMALEEELQDLNASALSSWEAILETLKLSRKPPLGIGTGIVPCRLFRRLFVGALHRLTRQDDLRRMTEAMQLAELERVCEAVHLLQESNLPDIFPPIRKSLFGRGLNLQNLFTNFCAPLVHDWGNRIKSCDQALEQYGHQQPIELGVHGPSRRVFSGLKGFVRDSSFDRRQVFPTNVANFSGTEIPGGANSPGDVVSPRNGQYGSPYRGRSPEDNNDSEAPLIRQRLKLMNNKAGSKGLRDAISTSQSRAQTANAGGGHGINGDGMGMIDNNGTSNNLHPFTADNAAAALLGFTVKQAPMSPRLQSPPQGTASNYKSQDKFLNLPEYNSDWLGRKVIGNELLTSDKMTMMKEMENIRPKSEGAARLLNELKRQHARSYPILHQNLQKESNNGYGAVKPGNSQIRNASLRAAGQGGAAGVRSPSPPGGPGEDPNYNLLQFGPQVSGSGPGSDNLNSRPNTTQARIGSNLSPVLEGAVKSGGKKTGIKGSLVPSGRTAPLSVNGNETNNNNNIGFNVQSIGPNWPNQSPSPTNQNAAAGAGAGQGNPNLDMVPPSTASATAQSHGPTEQALHYRPGGKEALRNVLLRSAYGTNSTAQGGASVIPAGASSNYLHFQQQQKEYNNNSVGGSYFNLHGTNMNESHGGIPSKTTNLDSLLNIHNGLCGASHHDQRSAKFPAMKSPRSGKNSPRGENNAGFRFNSLERNLNFSNSHGNNISNMNNDTNHFPSGPSSRSHTPGGGGAGGVTVGQGSMKHLHIRTKSGFNKPEYSMHNPPNNNGNGAHGGRNNALSDLSICNGVNAVAGMSGPGPVTTGASGGSNTTQLLNLPAVQVPGVVSTGPPPGTAPATATGNSSNDANGNNKFNRRLQPAPLVNIGYLRHISNLPSGAPTFHQNNVISKAGPDVPGSPQRLDINQPSGGWVRDRPNHSASGSAENSYSEGGRPETRQGR